MALAKTVGKAVLKGAKYATKGNIFTALASFMVAEALSRIIEDAAGDPEAAVEAINRAGQQQAQVKATLSQTQPLEVKEAVGQAFSGVRPERRLTELALMKRGALSITPEDTPVLSYISQKIGVPPHQLMELSNPSRMGDFSELQTVLPPQMREN